MPKSKQPPPKKCLVLLFSIILYQWLSLPCSLKLILKWPFLVFLTSLAPILYVGITIIARYLFCFCMHIYLFLLCSRTYPHLVLLCSKTYPHLVLVGSTYSNIVRVGLLIFNNSFFRLQNSINSAADSLLSSSNP